MKTARAISLLVIVSALCLSQLCSQEHSSIAAGYWNDNILFQRQLNALFGDGTLTGPDDLLTANFWVAYLSPGNERRDHADLFLNVITSRKQKVRFDLFSLRWMKEHVSGNWVLLYGTGLMLSGNFGGDVIQNLYHSVTGEDRVTFPYAGSFLTHVIVAGSATRNVLATQDVSLYGHLRGSFMTGGGPGRVEGGAGMIVHPRTVPRVRGELSAGYVDVYGAGGRYDEMFGSGPMTSVALSVRPFSDSWFTLWHAYSQYGRQQTHFGIIYSSRIVRGPGDARFP